MTNQIQSELAAVVVDACITHARQMLASQTQAHAHQRLDLMPSLKEMATQLYLAGVMWRFGEDVDLPTKPRDRGFICLLAMLVADGMSYQKAQERVAYLNNLSTNADGGDNPTILAGYNAAIGDGSLAAMLAGLGGMPGASGAPWRLLDLSKSIAAILTCAALLISKLLGSSWLTAIGVGCVLGIATLGVALIVHKQMVKT